MKPLVRLHRVHTFNKIGKLDTFYQKIFLHIVEHHHSKEIDEQRKKKITKMGQTLLQSFCHFNGNRFYNEKYSLNLVKAASVRSLGPVIQARLLSVQRLEQHSKCFQTNFFLCVERKMLQYSPGIFSSAIMMLKDRNYHHCGGSAVIIWSNLTFIANCKKSLIISCKIALKLN